MESRSCNPSEQKSTSLPYSFRTDRVTVHVSQGSVVDVIGVDAIVNAALSDQGDIVGIDRAISDKAGDTIKEEYRKYVIKHGSLQEGETLVTSAGELKYKGIIHCVKPKRWSSNSEKEEYVTKLNKAILNIFHEAENHGFFKIAMPAMRADSTASTDCNIYAEVYLRSIEDFCKMRPTHQITDVHFVDIDTDILLCIRSVCEKRKTLSSFQTPRASGFRLETDQKGKSRDSFGQVPHSIFVADSKPFSPRSSPIRQASMDPRVFETKLATMGRQIRSLSVPNEASLLSKTDQQVSLAHPSQVILGYPIQETSFPNQQFPSYKMNARPRGICLIISNREFANDTHHAKGEDLRSRDGTEIDSEKLADVFKRLHFIVVKKENLKDIEMTRALMDIARKDHDKYDCFVCCILSHGVQGKVYGSNSIPVEIGQLTSFVQPNSCPTLRDKPKVFFIQACQGPHTDQGFEMEADAVAHTTKLIPNEADFLLGYSTVSGYISYRAVGEGSLYIDKLVDMLNRYHKEMDLLGILTTVNDEVSKTDITYQGVYVKQMPQKVSTLRKRLCFQ